MNSINFFHESGLIVHKIEFYKNIVWVYTRGGQSPARGPNKARRSPQYGPRSSYFNTISLCFMLKRCGLSKSVAQMDQNWPAD